MQAELVDLAQQAAQALAHVAEQQEAGLHRVLEHLGEVACIDTDQFRRAQCLGADRVVRPVQKHQRLGEGAALADDLDDLLVARRRQAVQLYLTLDHQVEAFEGVALFEYRLPFRDPDTRRTLRNPFQLARTELGEQRVALQDLLHG